MKRLSLRTLALSALLGPITAWAAPLLNQVDNFQDGSTQGWTVGGANPNTPVNIATGGPGGAGDRYLQFQGLGGFGPGSRLSIFNTVQWAGNYTAAGITSISFSIANFGNTDFEIGLRVEGAGGSFSTLSPLLIPAGSSWQTVSFDLDESSLIAGGESDLPATLLNVFRLRIEDGSGGVIGTAGIDEIRAVPEPASLAMLALAVLGLRSRRA